MKYKLPDDAKHGKPVVLKDAAGIHHLVSLARKDKPIELEKGSKSCPFCLDNNNEKRKIEKNDEEGNVIAYAVGNKYPSADDHWVVVEVPRHDMSLGEAPIKQIHAYLLLLKECAQALMENPKTEYVKIFKNDGKEAGASQSHSHTQLIGAPEVPEKIMKLFHHAGEFRKQIVDSLENTYVKNGSFAALCPNISEAKYETWIVPKGNARSIVELGNAGLFELARVLKKALLVTYEATGWSAYNVGFVCAPKGIKDGQDFPFYITILPCMKAESGHVRVYGTPPVITVDPAESAEKMREIAARLEENDWLPLTGKKTAPPDPKKAVQEEIFNDFKLELEEKFHDAALFTLNLMEKDESPFFPAAYALLEKESTVLAFEYYSKYVRGRKSSSQDEILEENVWLNDLRKAIAASRLDSFNDEIKKAHYMIEKFGSEKARKDADALVDTWLSESLKNTLWSRKYEKNIYDRNSLPYSSSINGALEPAVMLVSGLAKALPDAYERNMALIDLELGKWLMNYLREIDNDPGRGYRQGSMNNPPWNYLKGYEYLSKLAPDTLGRHPEVRENAVSHVAKTLAMVGGYDIQSLVGDMRWHLRPLIADWPNDFVADALKEAKVLAKKRIKNAGTGWEAEALVKSEEYAIENYFSKFPRQIQAYYVNSN